MSEFEKNGFYWNLGFKMGSKLESAPFAEAKARWNRLDPEDKDRAQKSFYLGAEEGRKVTSVPQEG